MVADENQNEVPSLHQHNYVYATLQTSLLLNDISCAKVKPPCAAWSAQHRLGLAWALYRCKLGSLTKSHFTLPAVSQGELQETGSFHLLLCKRIALKRSPFPLETLCLAPSALNKWQNIAVIQDIPRIQMHRKDNL